MAAGAVATAAMDAGCSPSRLRRTTVAMTTAAATAATSTGDESLPAGPFADLDTSAA